MGSSNRCLDQLTTAGPTRSDSSCRCRRKAQTGTAVGHTIREADARGSQFLQDYFAERGKGRGRDLVNRGKDFGVAARGGWLAMRINDRLKESNMFLSKSVFFSKSVPTVTDRLG